MFRLAFLAVSAVFAAVALGAEASASDCCGPRSAGAYVYGSTIYAPYYHGPRGFGYGHPRWDYAGATYTSAYYVSHRRGHYSGPRVNRGCYRYRGRG